MQKLILILSLAANFALWGMSNELTPKEREFCNILVEIKGLQIACRLNDFQGNVPRRFQGLSLEQAQDRHKNLIPKVRALAAQFTREQLNKIETVAVAEATKERALTTNGGICAPFIDMNQRK